MTLAQIRHLARKRPEHEFLLNRLYGAHISPFFTLACHRLGLTPDQVTLLGGAFGVAGVAALFLPLGWWSIVAIVCLQVGYILDFSDGQVARLTGRTSVAGSYLDWLTHFYVPVAMVLATATSVALSTGAPAYLVAGTLAALELSAFHFSCKEHVLIAMQRAAPPAGGRAAFHAALRDDARPADVHAAPVDDATAEEQSGIAGRAHAGGARQLIGELLAYPGSVHLLSLAVVVDLAMSAFAIGAGPVTARGLLLVLWAVVFPLHLILAVRRNYRVIRAVEARQSDG